MSLAPFRNILVSNEEISSGILSNEISRAVREQFKIVRRTLSEPISLDRNFLKEQFNGLVGTWKEKTRFMSDPVQMTRLDEYQRIMELGKNAVPLLLRELRRRPDHWFLALEELTGENPVHPEHAGFIRAMTDDWVQWGKRQRLI